MTLILDWVYIIWWGNFVLFVLFRVILKEILFSKVIFESRDLDSQLTQLSNKIFREGIHTTSEKRTTALLVETHAQIA